MEQGPNFSLSPCLQPRAPMQCTVFVMAPGSWGATSLWASGKEWRFSLT